MLAGMETSDRDRAAAYGRAPRPGSSLWTVIGVTLAVLMSIAGLVVVGVMVLLLVGLSHYGSNK